MGKKKNSHPTRKKKRGKSRFIEELTRDADCGEGGEKRA